MIQTRIFTFLYPAHAALLQGAAAVPPIGVTFQDTMPRSPVVRLWGNIPPTDSLFISALHRMTPSGGTSGVSATVSLEAGVARRGRASSPSVLQAASSERGERRDSIDLSDRDVIQGAGIPTVPGTRPGIENFEGILDALVRAGLASSMGGDRIELAGPVWFKSPGAFSRPIGTLDDLKAIYDALKKRKLAEKAVCELYIPSASVVEIHFRTEVVKGGDALTPLKLSVGPRDPEAQPQTLDALTVPGDVRLRAVTMTQGIVQALEFEGEGVVKFLLDPESHDLYFLKLKPTGDVLPAVEEEEAQEIHGYIRAWLHQNHKRHRNLRSAMAAVFRMSPAKREEFKAYLRDMPKEAEAQIRQLIHQLSNKGSEAEEAFRSYLLQIVVAYLDAEIDRIGRDHLGKK